MTSRPKCTPISTSTCVSNLSRRPSSTRFLMTMPRCRVMNTAQAAKGRPMENSHLVENVTLGKEHCQGKRYIATSTEHEATHTDHESQNTKGREDGSTAWQEVVA